MTDLGGHKNRIDRSQREFIIATFLDKGLDEAQRVASGVGLADNYAHKLLHGLGMIDRAKPVVGQKRKAPRYVYQDGHWYVLKSHMIDVIERSLRKAEVDRRLSHLGVDRLREGTRAFRSTSM